MASTYAVGREQPFLEANLRLYREHIVGLEHAYWQKHINPLVMWAVYMIHIEAPERGSLRMRAVYEARQINRDGTGSGKIIGPFAYITPLLIELERQSKATCPPSYWTKRAPTTRKAEEQLRVDGFAQSTWFLKKYMQGEAPLTEDMLPTGAVRRGFVPSFTRAQIAAALAGKKQRAKRAPCERSHPAPDEAPARKRAVATAPCSQCGDPVLTESGCPGLAGVIGFRCVHCETVVCPDCTFRAVKETVDRRDAVLDQSSLCATCHGVPLDCPAACAAMRFSRVGYAAQTDTAELGAAIAMRHDHHTLRRAWAASFRTVGLMQCPRAECRCMWSVDLCGLGDEPGVACPRCDGHVCERCGAECPPGGHDCTFRRPALSGAAAGPADGAYAPCYFVETMFHAVFHMLQRRCANPQCGAPVFVSSGSSGAPCAACAWPAPVDEEALSAIGTTIAERLARGVAVLGAPELTAAERSGATAAGMNTVQWYYEQHVRMFEDLASHVPMLQCFGARHALCAAVRGGFEKKGVRENK